MKSEEINWNSIKTISEEIKGESTPYVGRHQYNDIMRKPESEWTPREKQKVAVYLSQQEVSEEAKKRRQKYAEEVSRKPEKKYIEHTYRSALNLFKHNFLEVNGKELVLDDLSNTLIHTIIYYMIGNKKRFMASPLLSKVTDPHMTKGLLIIGDYGVGKSSIMKAMQKTMLCTKNHFAFRAANDIVGEFEGIEGADRKDVFWKTYTSGTKLFDDLTTERVANNYGKVEVFKDILEMRYNNGEKTHVVMNFNGDSVDSTMSHLGNRYGTRVYDRLFEMFNVIEVKGQSKRR